MKSIENINSINIPIRAMNDPFGLFRRKDLKVNALNFICNDISPSSLTYNVNNNNIFQGVEKEDQKISNDDDDDDDDDLTDDLKGYMYCSRLGRWVQIRKLEFDHQNGVMRIMAPRLKILFGGRHYPIVLHKDRDIKYYWVSFFYEYY